MSWFTAAVLGLVQGLTEFLPISSSAHLRLVAALAGWPDPGAAFTAVTQLGTETAVLVFFRAEITAITTTWTRAIWTPGLRRDPNTRLGWYILLGILPIAILGLALQHPIETAFRDLRILAATLIGFGLVLGLADRVATNVHSLDRLTTRHALALGFAQSLALIPGVSRSGGTITAGLLLGYRREAAARISFLLAVPAVLASGALELTRIGSTSTPPWGQTAVATLIAFVVGYAVIAWFLRYLTHHRFTGFVAYRVLIGGAVLTLISIGALHPGA